MILDVRKSSTIKKDTASLEIFYMDLSGDFPTDNTMASSAETIKNVVIPAGIPVIAGEAGICSAGVATLSISYYDIGRKTGEMAKFQIHLCLSCLSSFQYLMQCHNQ